MQDETKNLDPQVPPFPPLEDAPPANPTDKKDFVTETEVPLAASIANPIEDSMLGESVFFWPLEAGSLDDGGEGTVASKPFPALITEVAESGYTVTVFWPTHTATLSGLRVYDVPTVNQLTLLA